MSASATATSSGWLLALIVLALALALVGSAGGTVEGRFASQVESGGNQFSAAADFSLAEAASVPEAGVAR